MAQTAPPHKRRSGYGWLIWLLVILLVAAAAVYGYRKHQAQTQTAVATTKGKHGGAGGKIRVITADATKEDLGVYLKGLGSVTPLNTVTVKSRVDGQLMKVLFTEGQMVKEGDSLVQLDSRPYEAQLAQYQAQKEHDQALLDNAKIDLQRYQTLMAEDSIPQQQLATQEALVKQNQATVDSDQALINVTQLNVTYCNITAPVSGRVGLRLLDQGNQVQASDTTGLVVITQIQPITVVFTIPEDSLPPVFAKLNAGQQLVVEAYDREGKKKLATGTLLTTDNQIDPTTGTLKLKAAFPNTDNALFPNQFVNVRLLVDTKKNVTVITVAAIQYGTQNKQFVYVVDDDDKDAPKTVNMQTVTVGTINGDKAEILTGVTPGDTVVIDGVDKLQNGSQVVLSGSTGSSAASTH